MPSCVTLLIRNESRSVSDLLMRCKKYPAIGVGERFFPSENPLAPLWPTKPASDWRNKVTELICSEAFIMTSPSNLLAAAHATAALMMDFGASDHADLGELQNKIVSDIRELAKNTAVITPIHQRRTILFVPSLTNRSVDYVLLGQANYLASGITMVFCNSGGKGSRGQSCVIGHNKLGYRRWPLRQF